MTKRHAASDFRARIILWISGSGGYALIAPFFADYRSTPFLLSAALAPKSFVFAFIAG
jgi:hypothetical protein